MTEGPLVEWKARLDAAENLDMNAQATSTNSDISQSPERSYEHVRQFLRENGWPGGQVVPHAEVPSKSLGPLQWWRLVRKYPHSCLEKCRALKES